MALRSPSSSSSSYSSLQSFCPKVYAPMSPSRLCSPFSVKCDGAEQLKLVNGRPSIPVLDGQSLPRFPSTKRLDDSINRSSTRLKLFSGSANPALATPPPSSLPKLAQIRNPIYQKLFLEILNLEDRGHKLLNQKRPKWDQLKPNLIIMKIKFWRGQDFRDPFVCWSTEWCGQVALGFFLCHSTTFFVGFEVASCSLLCAKGLAV